MTTLNPIECDKYCYDPEAGERVIRFIEKYCIHSVGRFAGSPFLLLDWQKELIRTLFAWKHRATGLRRFQVLYLITAKGAGKTPLLAAIALYMFIGEGEASPYIVSMASTFQQANLTFAAGKAFINESQSLLSVTDPLERVIRLRRKPGRWVIMSGKPTGRSGPVPSCAIADEAHEWSGAAVQSFELLTKNLMKRSQPLTLIATNAGPNRTCYAWQLHERALRVLEGTSEEETLLPVVYEAPQAMDWQSEEAARAANPSLGSVVIFDQLRPELIKAKQHSSAEAEYRRLYLSQWVAGSNKWLDMNTWEACVRPFDPANLDNSALYCGYDGSLNDDLCAFSKVWMTPEIIYVDAHFWLPRATAEYYERQDAIPYSKWAAEGAITLIDETTISDAVQKRIADYIIATNATQKIKALCYDRNYGEHVIASAESAGITCLPTPQGWTLSPSCQLLERRLKEGTIVIAPNSVMRMCAENAELSKPDQRGNSWIVKPNANGRYAGRRSAKVDGMVSLVTALVEARKHNFPNSVKRWTGKVSLISI